jgi:hypothetical protein
VRRRWHLAGSAQLRRDRSHDEWDDLENLRAVSRGCIRGMFLTRRLV